MPIACLPHHYHRQFTLKLFLRVYQRAPAPPFNCSFSCLLQHRREDSAIERSKPLCCDSFENAVHGSDQFRCCLSTARGATLSYQLVLFPLLLLLLFFLFLLFLILGLQPRFNLIEYLERNETKEKSIFKKQIVSTITTVHRAHSFLHLLLFTLLF